MHWPYTLDFTDSFLAAQTAAALMLTALLLFWRFGSWAVRGTLLFAIWLAGIAVAVPQSVAALGYHPGPEWLRYELAATAVVGAVACLLARRPVVAVVALLGQVPLWLASGFFKESEYELAGLHLAWLGLLVGLLLRREPPRASAGRDAEESSYASHDWGAFFLATALAAIVSIVVMHRRDGAADEWGYTFQAAVFAKGRIYSQGPRCEPFLEHMYVFESTGKLFSQYTPGWPLFIAPFVWIHAVWLSGPVSTGIMAVGMARLGRSAMRSYAAGDSAPTAKAIGIAGTWAAVLTTLGPMVLVNGGSRYPHVFVMGLYAWTLEALLMIATPGLSRSRQRAWGLALGATAVLNVAVRPADGAFVGLGAALVLAYFLVRRRVGWRALAAASGATAVCSIIVLVILRIQLGHWFQTGYSLNAILHPWNVIKFGKPTPAQWKYALPLATGAYCWWPCSFPLGLAGLALLRGKARALNAAFALGCLPYIAFQEYLDLGQRGYDWGYGPRYLMILIVPMCIGAAVALTPPTVAAFDRWSRGRTALSKGGPLALVVFAIVSTWVRVTPLVFPTVADQAKRHSALQRAVDDAHLTNAVVIASRGTTGFQDIDLPTNLPFELYPDQDVIFAIDRQMPAEATQCLRSQFPGRRIYYASGSGEVTLSSKP